MTLHLSIVLVLALPAAPQASSPTPLGDRFLSAFLEHQVTTIETHETELLGQTTPPKELQKQWRLELAEMLGLPRVLPQTPLYTTITGTLDAGDYTIRKLHYQSRPGLYVTGNLYVPKNLSTKVPGILYVCGHGNTFEEIEKSGKKVKRSLGSKVSYRHHPAMLAEKGYVCLVIDTLQLGEIEGLHHGTYREGMFWWQSYGFTPGGVECLNAMRGIDLLQSLTEVDSEKIGVTGRSGGGATTWWVAAMDERVQCGIGVAGLADLRAHLLAGEKPRFNQGVITGHCDCMFMVNLHRFDFARLGMLCAPRPMLLVNTDEDGIFPVGGFRRPAAKISQFYGKFGASDLFSVYMGRGDHVDTPELQAVAFSWLETHLKGSRPPRNLGPKPELPDWPLRVFPNLPPGENNTQCHEWFVNRQATALFQETEQDPAWWSEKKDQIRRALTQAVPFPLLGNKGESPKAIWQLVDNAQGKTVWDLRNNDLVIARAWTTNGTHPVECTEWVLVRSEQDPARTREPQAMAKTAILWLPGHGPMAISEKRTVDQGPFQTARRLALLGTTVAGVQTAVLLEALSAVTDQGKTPTPKIMARGDLSLVAMAASLLSPKPSHLKLEDYPLDWKKAPPFLGLAKVGEVAWWPLLGQAQTIELPQQWKERILGEGPWRIPASISLIPN